MRGVSSQPTRRSVAPVSLSSGLFLLAIASCISGGTSGCASVSAGSDPKPASARISITPSSVDFKSVIVGQKNSQTLTIANTGKESLDLNAAQVSGANFSIAANKIPLVLAPGTSASVTVVFAPSSASAKSGALVVYSPDFKTPVSVPLSGSGEQPAPALQISPATINFGSRVANSSTFESVTLKNTGNVPVTVSSASISNSVYSTSGLSNGVSLSPSQQLSFQVWFRPSSTGSWSATLNVSSSSLSAPLRVGIAGSATSTSTGAPSLATSHTVSLGWNSSTGSVAGYHVYRGEASGGPYSRISGSTITSVSYLDASVQPSSTYFYVVTAVESNGSESAFSNEVAVDIPN